MTNENKGTVDSSNTTNPTVTSQEEVNTLVKTTTTEVKELYSTGLVKSKFLVGEKLHNVKVESKVLDETAYDRLVVDLPFNKGQADKYVSLYTCEWARELVFGDYAHNFPETFTTLYKLTQKKWSDFPEYKEKLVTTFTEGSVVLNSESVKTSEFTTSDFDKLVKSFSNVVDLKSEGDKEGAYLTEKTSDEKPDETKSDDKSNNANPPKEEKLTVLTVKVNEKTFAEYYDGFNKLLETLKKLKVNASCDWNEKAVNQYAAKSKVATALKKYDELKTPQSVFSKAS